MARKRRPTTNLSWIGIAAHEIDEITSHGASRSASLARELAENLVRVGHRLLALDPRATARANHGPEAVAARAEMRRAEEARRRRVMGEDDFGPFLRGERPRDLAA